VTGCCAARTVSGYVQRLENVWAIDSSCVPNSYLPELRRTAKEREINRCISLGTLLLLVFLVACGGGSSTTTSTTMPVVAVAISPSSTNSLVNQPTQFTATVTGTSNSDVRWSVQESDGGTVAAGLYTAPWMVATHHVVATSEADPSKSEVATVGVSARFAFLENLPNGQNSPFSTTPLLGTFGTDGTFAAKNINDPETGKPADTTDNYISLSSDGEKMIFEMYMGTGFGIGIANADGTGLVEFRTPPDMADDQPQFSPEGKQIVFVEHATCTPISPCLMLGVMNADGSNKRTFPPPCNTASFCMAWWVGHPSFSPDGSKIVAEVAQLIGNDFYKGIATMNSDGSNLKQLTGEYDPNCQPGWGTRGQHSPMMANTLFSAKFVTSLAVVLLWQVYTSWTQTPVICAHYYHLRKLAVGFGPSQGLLRTDS
jgi:hypothetical protein